MTPFFSPELPALRFIGWPSSDAVYPSGWAACLDAYSQAQPGRIVQQHRNGYWIAFAVDAVTKISAPAAWQRPDYPAESRATVGDWVLVMAGQIVTVLPRFTVLKRVATGQSFAQQMIASNINTALVLCGLDQAASLQQITRYCLMAASGGVEPVIVLTKADRCKQWKKRLQGIIAAVGKAAVLTLDPRDRHALTQLDPWMRLGETLVVVGPSGAGKSTLCNGLLGQCAARTGAVRRLDGSGRHTTSQRTLWSLPSGACLIDTPGMRALKPTGEERLDLEFREIVAYAHQCRFRDCQHGNEPGCAVRAAVEAGQLSSRRVRDFLVLRRDIADQAKTVALRGSQKDRKLRQIKPQLRED